MRTGGGSPPTVESQVRLSRLDSEIPRDDLKAQQQDDNSMAWVYRAKEWNTARPDWEDVDPANRAYWLLWDVLELRDGVLCRRWEAEDGSTRTWKIVLPHSMRPQIMTEVHGGISSGHLGVTKILGKLKQRFYWPKMYMYVDVRTYIRKCGPLCQKKDPSSA